MEYMSINKRGIAHEWNLQQDDCRISDTKESADGLEAKFCANPESFWVRTKTHW